MPSYECKCEKRIDIGPIPNPNEWLMISDTNYDDFSGQIDAEYLYGKFIHMLKCPSCGRLWIFWEGFDKFPTCYEK